MQRQKSLSRNQELSPQVGRDEDKVSVKGDGFNWNTVRLCEMLKKTVAVQERWCTQTDLHREERKGNIASMWSADSQGRVNRWGGALERTRRQRSSSNEYLVGVLPESWLVCSSINSWILHSSFFFLWPASFRRRILRRCGARPLCLLSGTANWIQLDWPKIFSSSQLWPNPSLHGLWHVFKC